MVIDFYRYKNGTRWKLFIGGQWLTTFELRDDTWYVRKLAMKHMSPENLRLVAVHLDFARLHP